MVSNLDTLIEWLLDQIVSSGKDGVSFSQFLAFIDAFYDDPDRLPRGKSGTEATPTGRANLIIDRHSREAVWKSFKSHPDVLVGEDKCGNDLKLSEIEALPLPATGGPGHPKVSSSEILESNHPEYGGQALLERDPDEHSIASAELLGQLEPQASQNLLVRDRMSTPCHDYTEVALRNDSQLQPQSSRPTRAPETFPTLTSQPRIYVSQERIMRTAILGDNICNRKVQDLERLAHPPKRRGRPPKIKTSDPPARRDQSPKAAVSTRTFRNSPALPTPQQTSTTEPSESENLVNFEFISEPQKRFGRQMHKVATFTSHDELQRAFGTPGVYFDLVGLGRTGVGRPKIRKIALFKSEKLKSFQWMKGDTGDAGTSTTSDQPLNIVDPTTTGDSMTEFSQDRGRLGRKRSLEPELEAARCEPEPKKRLLDMVRDFGSSHSAPYTSPYLSTTPASYISPYSANPSVATISSNRDASVPNIPDIISRKVSTPLRSAIAKGSVMISEYSSPYAPMQLTSSKPSDQSSTLNTRAELLLDIEASKRTKDDQLEAAIKSAGELVVPNFTVRLPSSKDGTAGNLCLSTDKKSLTFITGENQTSSKPMIIQVSDIVESPETSKFGSGTTILRITSSSTKDSHEIHHFRFLPTEAAYRAANIMRAKIVTAMMLSDLEAGTEIVEPEKPFRCSGCDGAWKNWEGLKYHETKSKTLCNPNYRPRKEPSPLASDDVLGLATAALGVLDGEVTAQSQKNTFLNDSAVEQQPAKQPTHMVADVKFKDARSDLELQDGKDIIMSLLDAHEQVFPGENSVWYAFVAARLQKSPGSGLPDYGTCKNALDLLVDNGQIRMVQFSFKDKIGLMKMRTLLTGPDVDPTSSVVKLMKENIKTVFPEYYIPPGFAPPKVVQSMLEERQIRPEVTGGIRIAQKAAPPQQTQNLVTEQMPHTPFNDTPSNKVTRSGRISRTPQRLQQAAWASPVRNWEDEDDESHSEGFSTNNLMPLALDFAKDGRQKRRRSKTFKPDSQGSNPNEGTNVLHEHDLLLPPQTMVDESRRETDSGRPQRKRMKYEMRPTGVAPDRNVMWQPAPTYLQEQNGAWNTPTPSRLIRKYAPRTAFPEPITYMQTLNGSAWNFRPYGHGVRPIHARPTKRAEGQTAYLTKIQYGFRPVMMPNGEVFIPTTPLNNAIGQNLENTADGVSQSAGRKRKYTRRSTTLSKPQECSAEGLPQSARLITEKRQYARSTLSTSNTQIETFQPITMQQQVATPKIPSVISTVRSVLPEDEHAARLLSISSESSNLLNDSDQGILDASVELGAEFSPFDDRPRERKGREQYQQIAIAQYMMTARRLTALPADLEGLEKSLADHPELTVEVAVDHQHNIRRRTKEGAISSDTEFRIMIAVVVIRTLTGGLDKQIDWVLVSKLFPEFPMNAVSKRWPKIYTKHRQMVERLCTDFQDFFLEAYERGEVSPIDYDHLVDYDWNSLVDLVQERIDINPSKTTAHRLPPTRSSFNQMFDMTNAQNNKPWRDDYFGLQPPVYKRMEHAASEQYTVATSQPPPANLEIDELTIAKSWVRANTLTPPESYDQGFAARKLATLGPGLITTATTALLDAKVLMQRNKGRPTPHRGVEITDTFAAALRKHLDETHLSQAAAFKARLDARFRARDTVMLEWAARDGDVLAITNLQAWGRVRVVPRGVPVNRFGLTGGGYQTKRMDKARLRFGLEIVPTERYVYDEDLAVLADAAAASPPLTGIATDTDMANGGAAPVPTPLWTSFTPTSTPIVGLWKKTLCAVLATVALRPGVVLAELVRLFTPAVEEWEMRVLVEWAVGQGVLEVLVKGGEGKGGEGNGLEGWNVGEWWWLVGGRAGEGEGEGKWGSVKGGK